MPIFITLYAAWPLLPLPRRGHLGPEKTTQAVGSRDSAKEHSVALSRLIVYPLSVALVVALAGRAAAVHPSELLLPATTKGFISTQDVDEVRNRFNETQFGEMAHDPVMQPFVDDLKKQIAAKLERAGKKLGIKWPDRKSTRLNSSHQIISYAVF